MYGRVTGTGTQGDEVEGVAMADPPGAAAYVLCQVFLFAHSGANKL